MNVQRGRLERGGTLHLPADVRAALGLADGDSVEMRVVDGELRVSSTRDAIARVQAMMRAYVPEGVLLSEELIAERRAAAENE